MTTAMAAEKALKAGVSERMDPDRPITICRYREEQAVSSCGGMAELQQAKLKLGTHDDPVCSAAAAKTFGRVQVAIRCRPLIGRDAGQLRCFDTDENTIRSAKAGSKAETWDFENVFEENSGTQHIHQRLTSTVVRTVLAGFHGTIFAYGQTGATPS